MVSDKEAAPVTVEKPLSHDRGEPYVFICYAHKDAEKVYAEIVRLRNQGINVWYDEGISPGSAWSDELAQAISDCALFLVFVTPQSSTSEYCLKELNFAQNKARRVLAVHLEKTDLPMGLELNLSNRQAVLAYELAEGDYHRKLNSVLAETLGADTPAIDSQVGSPSRRYAPSIGLLVIVLVGVAGYWLVNRTVDDSLTMEPVASEPDSSAVQDIPPNSIAVLPFENLSASEDDAYFAVAVHQDVLASISRIRALKVIARTSVLKLDPGLGLDEIGQQLQVANVMEGTVRRVGDQVRITVELINVVNQENIWGEVYDRKLDDILAVQSEIAQEISGALKINLDVGTANRISSVVKVDPEIFDQYLRARALFNAGTTEGYEGAAEILDEVTREAPDFAKALAYRALVLVWRGPQWTSTAVSDEALLLAERAIALMPDAFEGHYAKARVLSLQRRFEEADRFYQEAQRLDPNNADIKLAHAMNAVSDGDLNSAIEVLTGFTSDPLNPLTHFTRAHLASTQGDYGGAARLIELALQLAGGDTSLMLNASGLYLRLGDKERALELKYDVAMATPTVRSIGALTMDLLDLNELDAAEQWLQRLAPQRARNAEIKLLQKQGRLVEQRELIEAMLAEMPNPGSARRLLAYNTSAMAGIAGREERVADERRLLMRAVNILESTLVEAGRDGKMRFGPFSTYDIAAYMSILHRLEDPRSTSIARDIIQFYGGQEDFLRTGGFFNRGLSHLILGDKEQALQDFIALGEPSAGGFLDLSLFDRYGLTDPDTPLGVLANNIRFRNLVAKLKERDRETVKRLSESIPGLFTASLPEPVGRH